MYVAQRLAWAFFFNLDKGQVLYEEVINNLSIMWDQHAPLTSSRFKVLPLLATIDIHKMILRTIDKYKIGIDNMNSLT